MNEAYFHLAVNHLPIILITGFISKSVEVKRKAYLNFFIGALNSIAGMTSGEGAENIVEKINGVDESLIETHKKAAELFSILTYILGGLTLIGLLASFKQKIFSKTISTVTLLFAFVVLYFGIETGTTGGEIRHTEIRSGNNSSTLNDDYRKEKDDD